MLVFSEPEVASCFYRCPAAWSLQDIVLFIVACARIHLPFILPARLHCPHCCNSIARLLGNIRPPHRPPFCMAYTIQSWQWRYRVRAKLQLLMNRYRYIRFAQIAERVLKAFAVLIIGNSRVESLRRTRHLLRCPVRLNSSQDVSLIQRVIITSVLRFIMDDGLSFESSIACSEFFRVPWVNRL